ncbi:MAG: DJ-1 family protein [Porphyromonadaceae bacterium CG2_30_38_12]|nr:MAG: DJ-1 family protein [Porphyromonadaceae bacterium CG2_30_38_12]
MYIYLFLAPGFEEIEAITPIDVFRRAGIEVTTVSITGDKLVCGAHGICIQADALFEAVTFSPDSLLFLPGGMPGTTHLENHVGLKALIKTHAAQAGKLAAICAAPSILGNMGLLDGKKATCYPGFEQALQHAVLGNAEITKDNSIYCAKAAGLAMEFTLLLVSDINGKAISEQIRKAMFVK